MPFRSSSFVQQRVFFFVIGFASFDFRTQSPMVLFKSVALCSSSFEQVIGEMLPSRFTCCISLSFTWLIYSDLGSLWLKVVGGLI